MPSSPVPGVEFTANIIVTKSTSWNYDLVNKLFLPSDAALILATPLSWSLPPDKLIWHYDAKCVFSVKSAYKIAFTCRFEASSSHSVSRGVLVWKALWKATVPGKVQMCVWRACRDILPTHANLVSSSQFALLLMIIHGIWRAKNALLWENKVANPALVSYLSKLQLSEFIKARPGPISRPLQVVQAVGSQFQRSSPMDLLVDDIRASLRTFVDSQVCYVRRSANAAAHGMAKLAMSFPIEFCWFEEPPNPIVEALVDVF
ncbi:uncharacterized protein [Pyrus communis]|uniref:uncharacterized protein n=1 Tax=Pyrus communis TaxID=23211 RepID=UPI0035BF815F